MEIIMPRTKEAFQQIRDESKQHILSEAAKVFAKKGLANTKISDLAEAAGVSQGLLYRYFDDKEDVFIALLERAISGVIQYGYTSIKQTGTPMEKLNWLTAQVLKGMSEEPVYFQLISQAMALSGRLYATLEKLGTFIQMLRELISEGQKLGEIVKRNPDQLVLLYLSCLFGLAAGKSLNLHWLNEHFPCAEEILQILKP
jgi:AcrR family transcriptional regulator